MYSYSSSSMSLYGNSSRNSTPTRRFERRSPVSSPVPECATPKRTATVTTPPPPPPPIESACKSPFTTPNHPLYMFGDSNNNHEADDVVVPRPAQPSRPQKAKNSLDSTMNDLSLSSPSPFRRLQLSRTFDHNDEEEEFETPRRRGLGQYYQSPPQVAVQHREIRRSNAFGMEQMREMSMDSVTPLQQKLVVIERDLEGEDGLALRLRRMKRRLFLENVASSSPPQESLDEETPKHSNQMSTEKQEEVPPMNDVTMEGMEVVLEDQGDAPSATNSDSIDGLYLTFSSSSLSLQMEIEQEDDDNEDEDDDEYPSSETADWLVVPTKKLSGDSSVVTEATAACSTFGNSDTHWASLSSITEYE